MRQLLTPLSLQANTAVSQCLFVHVFVFSSGRQIQRMKIHVCWHPVNKIVRRMDLHTLAANALLQFTQIEVVPIYVLFYQKINAQILNRFARIIGSFQALGMRSIVDVRYLFFTTTGKSLSFKPITSQSLMTCSIGNTVSSLGRANKFPRMRSSS